MPIANRGIDLQVCLELALSGDTPALVEILCLALDRRDRLKQRELEKNDSQPSSLGASDGQSGHHAPVFASSNSPTSITDPDQAHSPSGLSTQPPLSPQPHSSSSPLAPSPFVDGSSTVDAPAWDLQIETPGSFYQEVETLHAFGLHHDSIAYQPLSTRYWLPLWAMLHQHVVLMDFLRVVRARNGADWTAKTLRNAVLNSVFF